MSLMRHSKLVIAFLTGAATTAAFGYVSTRAMAVPPERQEQTAGTVFSRPINVVDIISRIGALASFGRWTDEAQDHLLEDVSKPSGEERRLFISRRQPVLTLKQKDIEQTCINYSAHPKEASDALGARETLMVEVQLTEAAYGRLIAASKAAVIGKATPTTLDLRDASGLTYASVQVSQDSLKRLPSDLKKGFDRSITLTFGNPFIGVGVDFLMDVGANVPIYPCVQKTGFGEIRALFSKYAANNPRAHLISNMLEIQYPNHP